MQYWLLKSEPQTYSIDHLKQERVGTWDGVRNYTARNNLRAMKKGDLVFFYHSSATVIGIVGIAVVTTEAYADPTQFDPQSSYYDPKATREKPIWSVVDVRFKKKFKKPILLETLKQDPQLRDMALVQPGSRLSVQPVSAAQYAYILKTYGGAG